MRVDIPEVADRRKLGHGLVLGDVDLGHVALLLLMVLLLLHHGPDYVLVLQLGVLRNASRAVIGFKLVLLEVCISTAFLLMLCFNHERIQVSILLS